LRVLFIRFGEVPAGADAAGLLKLRNLMAARWYGSNPSDWLAACVGNRSNSMNLYLVVGIASLTNKATC
jgi:hypothetical protein